jgi:hypothetical protein
VVAADFDSGDDEGDREEYDADHEEPEQAFDDHAEDSERDSDHDQDREDDEHGGLLQAFLPSVLLLGAVCILAAAGRVEGPAQRRATWTPPMPSSLRRSAGR